MTAVAVVGLGAMGSRLARRLLDAGHEVIVWNRSPERVTPLLDLGAIPAATPAEAASRAEALITMVADPLALRMVTQGSDGIAAGADGSLTVIEMSTVGPSAVAWLSSTLPPDTGLVDAPVLGSLDKAESGSLVIFVGGPPALVDRVEPLLSTLGTPVHVGALGSGAAAKLVANASQFGTLGILGEAIALANALGLSDEATYQVLATTPLADQAERRRSAIERGDYPPRFSLALARKDADLIIQAAEASQVDLRLVDAARTWIADADVAGLAGRDYTAMLARILAGARSDRRWPRFDRRGFAADARPADYDGLILDLDGVVWLDGDPLDGAAGAIARLRASGKRVVFLTNDTRSTKSAHAARLVTIGIPATAADVITAAAATARFLRSRREFANQGVFVVGSPALRDEIGEIGLRIVSAAEARQAKAVVVGCHPGFDYAELRAATAAITNGATLVAAGRDAVFPTPDGSWPATGAIVAAIEAAAGVGAIVVGKPEPFMFQTACEALDGCRRIAVIGDHPVSDIAGARGAGLDAILVLTGVASRPDLEQAPVAPDLVFDSLAGFADAAC